MNHEHVSSLGPRALFKGYRVRLLLDVITLALLASLFKPQSFGQADSPKNAITVDWDKTIQVSKSTASLQVVVNPMLRSGSPIHDGSFAALKDLGADYVRYVPWEPYPKLAVAELDPPTKDSTSWDFTLIDPMTKDFLAATEGHSTIMNFSTIPAWLFKTEKPVVYPGDPDQVFWDYTQGTELKDPSGKEVADYFARLVSWYTRGGFVDENGKQHNSGYHYKFPYWEVLNEVDFEHSTTPELYTQRYDAIVSAIHAVSPDTKFVGLALAQPSNDPKWFEYFLDPAHHQPGIPMDYISYHFYATPTLDEDINTWQFTFFDQADQFLATTRYIESIRKRLSPDTRTDTDELGIILPTDGLEIAASKALPNRIPSAYWAGAGALYAYLFIELNKIGIDVIGESQLVGYPSQFPSVSMMDWTNGKPNARLWVLRLIKDNFGPGDKLVATKAAPNSTDVLAQGFVTAHGRKLLLVNKRNRVVDVTIPGSTTKAKLQTVDEATGDGPARSSVMDGTLFKAPPFSVTVVSWP
jgi:hypothetical protein